MDRILKAVERFPFLVLKKGLPHVPERKLLIQRVGS
jgi:hypothetical protein